MYTLWYVANRIHYWQVQQVNMATCSDEKYLIGSMTSSHICWCWRYWWRWKLTSILTILELCSTLQCGHASMLDPKNMTLRICPIVIPEVSIQKGRYNHLYWQVFMTVWWQEVALWNSWKTQDGWKLYLSWSCSTTPHFWWITGIYEILTTKGKTPFIWISSNR